MKTQTITDTQHSEPLRGRNRLFFGSLCSDPDSSLLSCPQRRLAFIEWSRSGSEDEGDEEKRQL